MGKVQTRRRRRKSRVALVCAGGGVTGAIYEIGCLRALEEVVDRSATDLDLYVGVSGGAFVTSLLASGVSPREMYAEATSHTRSPLGVAEAPLYRLGLGEFLKRSLRAPAVITRALLAMLKGDEGKNLPDLAWSLFELLPSGLLDTSGIQEYFERFFASRGLDDRFDALRHELFVVAVDLDNGEAVAFGEEGHREVKVSQAVQASTALPGLYRPVRICGRDYVDGGVKKTAHINLAIRHGADLVICINPVVPVLNDTEAGGLRGHLANRGVTFVLDQVLRIMLHGRMAYGLERYAAEHPEVDILLLEPDRADLRMFSYNMMKYSARREVAEHGYRSTLATLTAHKARFTRVLAKHGLRLTDPATAPSLPEAEAFRSEVAKALGSSLDRLDRRLSGA